MKITSAKPFGGWGSRHVSKWLILVLLMVVGLTNYMDRLSISILQVPIKADLGLTDTQLGAITGLSFSLVYTCAAIPLARLADRLSPKLVTIVCLAAWNALTMLCGLANSFLALAVLRMGVAIGEAGCVPAAQALLATHFPPEQRGRAIAIWQMVFPLGTLLGIFFSGMLSAALGWRATFMVLGGVGLLVVPLVMIFLPGGRTAAAVAEPPGQEVRPGTMGALRYVLSSRAYRLLLIGGFLAAVPLNATLNWNAPFYGRVYALPIEQVTIIVALIAGVGGAAGMFGGGFLSDMMGRRDSRWYCWLPALALLIAPLTTFYQYLVAATPGWSLPAGILGAALLNCWMPPQAAIAQSLVTGTHRAVAAACILVTGGLGAAVGPFATGLLSDVLAARGMLPGTALAWSIVSVSLCSIPAALLFFMAGLRLRADLAAVPLRPGA